MNAWFSDFTSRVVDVSSGPFLADLTVRATVLLFLAIAATWLLRRRSAAISHVVWVAAFCGLLVLPVLNLMLPGWGVLPAGWSVSAAESSADESVEAALEYQRAADVDQWIHSEDRRPVEGAFRHERPHETVAVIAIATDRSADSNRVTPANRNWIHWNQLSPTGGLVVLWMTGFALCLLRVAVSHFWLRGVIRRGKVVLAGPVRDALTRIERQTPEQRRVRLVVTEKGTMPMACGIRIPTLLIPKDASDWTESQQRSVLLHEHGHILRRDPLWKLLVEIGRAAYWFHPLAWLAARRAAAVRELACDDLVLRSGVPAADYARHLLDVVSGGRLRRLNMTSGVAMASTNRLDRRMRSIMDAARDRRPFRRFAVVTALVGVTCILVPIAMLRSSENRQTENQPVERGRETDEAGDAAASDVWEVRLQAVDERTGEAIPNPTFIVQLGGDRWTQHAGDEHGEFIAKFDNRTPRYCYLKVRADGYAAMQGFWSNRRDEPADELPEQLEFEMEPSITVGGTVVDEEGKAVKGATVYFGASNIAKYEGHRVRQQFWRESILTDTEGRWLCSLVPPGVDSGSIRIEHPEFVRPDPHINFGLDDQLNELKDQTHRWELQRGFTIRGQITDGNGLPVEGVALAVGELNLYRESGPFPRTDADGRFEFPRVAALHYRDVPPESHEMTITAMKPGFAPVIELIPGFGGRDFGLSTEESRIIDLALVPGESIKFNIRDAEGNPVPGTRVRISQWNGTDALGVLQRHGVAPKADAEDGWSWDWAPEGEVEYGFQAQGFRSQRLGITAAGGVHEVILEREQVITGRVVDADTGDPIPLFHVEPGYRMTRNVPVSAEYISWMPTRDTRGADGEYRMAVDFDLDRLHYRVLAEGYEPAESAAITVEEGEVTLDFELRRIEAEDKPADMSQFDAGSVDASFLAQAEGCLARRFLILEALAKEESAANRQLATAAGTRPLEFSLQAVEAR